eukprot:Rhum_TRINITY_DN15149_c0_g1::Rhum_TRINITY_DN15149_c0_g1_i1::g.141525::m.141525
MISHFLPLSLSWLRQDSHTHTAPQRLLLKRKLPPHHIHPIVPPHPSTLVVHRRIVPTPSPHSLFIFRTLQGWLLRCSQQDRHASPCFPSFLNNTNKQTKHGSAEKAPLLVESIEARHSFPTPLSLSLSLSSHPLPSSPRTAGSLAQCCSPLPPLPQKNPHSFLFDFDWFFFFFFLIVLIRSAACADQASPHTSLLHPPSQYIYIHYAYLWQESKLLCANPTSHPPHSHTYHVGARLFLTPHPPSTGQRLKKKKKKNTTKQTKKNASNRTHVTHTQPHTHTGIRGGGHVPFPNSSSNFHTPPFSTIPLFIPNPHPIPSRPIRPLPTPSRYYWFFTPTVHGYGFARRFFFLSFCS